jgi:hypothetical protein
VLAPSPKLSIRYYLWTDEGPFRFPDRLHHQLIEGRVQLPQFAGTRQKFVEVLSPKSEVLHTTVRGIIYAFDKNGFLDLGGLRQAMPTIPRFLGENGITDLSPALKKRRFGAEHTWLPDVGVLDRIKSDLDFGVLKKIPTFRAVK